MIHEAHGVVSLVTRTLGEALGPWLTETSTPRQVLSAPLDELHLSVRYLWHRRRFRDGSAVRTS